MWVGKVLMVSAPRSSIASLPGSMVAAVCEPYGEAGLPRAAGSSPTRASSIQATR